MEISQERTMTYNTGLALVASTLAVLYAITRLASHKGGEALASTSASGAEEKRARSSPEPEAEEAYAIMFQHACSKVSSMPGGTIPPEAQLMLYGLYKQATVGDCNIKEPSKLNMAAHAKYMAWVKLSGMPRPVAMVNYVEGVQNFEKTREDRIANGSGGVAPEIDNDDIIYNKDDEYDLDEEEVEEDELKKGEETERKMLSPMGMHYSVPMGPSVPSSSGDVSSPNGRLLKAVVSGDVTALQSALSDGASSSHADSSGQTVLHFAADKGNMLCLTLLLESGADPNAVDNEGISVLHAAVIGGHVEVSRTLLEAGADPNLEDIDGDTPKSCADDGGDDAMIALFQSL
mmetsp:Transcript_25685/g.52599  ORF Transcript_25685/g.52599 Transcript_25685/m.52599 type:complete len:347 (-) Transcript_25685:122-1162(-)